MKQIKILLILSFVSVLASCAGMADFSSKIAGIGQISEEKSTFDDSTTIRMSPAFLYREGAWLGVPIKLGAAWNNKSPETVALIMSYSSDVASSGGRSYTNFLGLDVNLNGDIQSYDVVGLTQHDSSGYNTVSQTIYTESKGTVVVPMSVLEQMLSTPDVRLRIRTQDGYQDAQFSIERIPGGQSTAILHLHKFVEKIKQVKVGD
jgi:hypothetical protein